MKFHIICCKYAWQHYGSLHSIRVTPRRGQEKSPPFPALININRKWRKKFPSVKMLHQAISKVPRVTFQDRQLWGKGCSGVKNGIIFAIRLILHFFAIWWRPRTLSLFFAASLWKCYTSSPHGPLHPRQINARERAWMSFYKLSTIHASQPITMTKITPFSRQGEYRTVAMGSTGWRKHIFLFFCPWYAIQLPSHPPLSTPPTTSPPPYKHINTTLTHDACREKVTFLLTVLHLHFSYSIFKW